MITNKAKPRHTVLCVYNKDVCSELNLLQLRVHKLAAVWYQWIHHSFIHTGVSDITGTSSLSRCCPPGLGCLNIESVHQTHFSIITRRNRFSERRCVFGRLGVLHGALRRFDNRRLAASVAAATASQSSDRTSQLPRRAIGLHYCLEPGVRLFHSCSSPVAVFFVLFRTFTD